jgi:hypothetical protein
MSPESLPWWGWFFYAAGTALVAYVIFSFTAKQEPRSEISIAITYICVVIAIFCAIVGIILFVGGFRDIRIDR